MPEGSSDILFDKSEGIATITLNRPHRLNALTPRMWREQLPELWQAADQDPAVRVIIFTGAGERAFCSGADVQALAELAQEAQLGGSSDQTLLISARHNQVAKPVITAVNGMCVGGGLMFVADSDITIAAEHATFFNPGVSIGQLAFVAPTTWTRWVPFPALMRMTLMGSKERVDARRAAELGIVTEVVPGPSLAGRAREIAGLIASNSPAAVRASKRILWEALEHNLGDAHDFAKKVSADYRGHPDSVEGPKAFTEKRPPKWKE
ncbi:MAG TPA: enoyl-CoA hydratase/isomerase family protein [Candidatus Binataceae bacterium]|nr:enoyl-CoA hydratase/isomerase family protein [Candidatus Binataceae bacterium]